ncbi:uncharacterized protein BKA55DRAFT_734271 [Fusarium redolens]|uniref:Uncharacterized protein n=1 Tax=Fusarium redolens TaxID=48865 RepID=A0A9P9HX93_FUSRE|nr:uncharacterized protein BKA55DRAFT_734271 [Fusarium redolens]KAH7264936.1 hypothetical protein BKA55DRAFT_734271 [Fusarium redolens]
MAEAIIAHQITEMIAELGSLRKSDAAQKTEIENLRAQNDFHANEAQMLRDLRLLYEAKLEQKDSKILGLHVLLDKVKVEAGIYRDDLSELRKQLKDLQAKHESTQKQICATEAKLSRRNFQVAKLVSALGRKVAANRISLVALRAAYKIIPSLEHQVQYEKVLSMAKKLPHKTGIEREMKECLREAGFSISFDKKGFIVLSQSVDVAKVPVDGSKELDESIIIVDKDADKIDDKVSEQDAQQSVKKDEDVQMSV